MSLVIRFVTYLFRGVVRLYPRSFRVVFSEEMRAVFADVVMEAAQRGRLALVSACLRELRDSPRALLSEYWLSLGNKNGETNMSKASEINGIPEELQVFCPGSWRGPILAGLPHLLVALVFGLAHMSYALLPASDYQRWRGFLVVFGASFFVLAGGMVIWGWRRRWPDWTASWIGYGWVLLLVVLGALIRRLDIVEAWKVNNALILGGLVLAAIGYLWLAKRDRLKGLLVALFLLPMAPLMMTLEFVYAHVEGLVFLGVGLIAALTAAGIVRLGNWRAGIWLAVAANLLAGLAISYATVYQVDVPARDATGPALLRMVGSLAAYIFVSGALITGPIWGWALWERGRRLSARR